MKSYNEDSNVWYFLEVDVQYPEELHELHNDLQFLPERTKIEKVKKLVANLHVIQIKNLKPALNHKLVLKKVHTVIKFK